MRVREPVVAGRFYTADPVELRREVEGYLRDAVTGDSGTPRGLIVPHAGHVYSGPIAGSAYATVHRARRVVLAGPAHFVPIRGMAAPESDIWRTPLGLIPIDTEGIAELGLTRAESVHTPEHSLEVQLPFLQVCLEPGWTLLPIVVGRADPQRVADVLTQAFEDPETLVVLSTDLSHYHPYEVAVAADRLTADLIAARDWEDIADDDACGAYPLRGMLLAANRLDLAVRLLDLRNSGDTYGSRDRVVGYGAFTVGA